MSESGVLMLLFVIGDVACIVWLLSPPTAYQGIIRCAIGVGRVVAVAWAASGMGRAAALVYGGTPLQMGLARLWIAGSLAWVIHAGLWFFAHCQGSVYGGYNCSISASRDAHWGIADLTGYFLTTPFFMLFAALATYWVIRGFHPRRNE